MKIQVLDLGYVEVVEAWGHGKEGRTDTDGGPYETDFEVGIIEAARQSTQGSFRGWSTDEWLLRTLFLNDPQHGTPFEFAGMVIEVQAPLGVFREWHRHRTQSYNEMSARYAPLPDLYYLPTLENVKDRAEKAATTKNKQLQGAVKQQRVPSGEEINGWLTALEELYRHAEDFYRYGLELGIPKELARWGMPVGHYSRMRASANLRNWFQFLRLRNNDGVMWEMREYAKAVEEVVKAIFPHTWELFDEQRSAAQRAGG